MFKEETALRRKRIELGKRVIGSRLLRENIPLAVGFQKVDTHTPFADRPDGAYPAITEGTPWGSGQDRAWFHIRGNVPAHWTGDRVVLWFDCGTEALVYRINGQVLHGLTSGPLFLDTPWKMSRPLADVTEDAKPGDAFEYWIEAACLSHPWEETYDGPIPPPLSTAGFPDGVLKTARLGWLDETVWALYMDVEVLASVVDGLPEGNPRKNKIFRALNLALDLLGREPDNVAAARAILQPLLEAPAHASAITVRATGHAHLDTAWLWTTSVAREKAARTFSNQLTLLDRYPDYVFGASSALHYQWIKEDHPALFQRIKKYVREGRWEIQGAMWIEADTNMPSGESLIRQFLYGRKFFREEFGIEPDLLWLPDVFGYSAALPQIMRICGVNSMLTQKISWSQFNKFPHHTFIWEGIDGSDVLVHFPPEDNYISSLTAEELIKAERRFAENDRLDHMLSLFGYGDGGGGPTPFHLERARRLHNLEGAPRVNMGRADTLFHTFHEQADLLHRWVGELYLELHRKTLTTQAFIKQVNRRLEERLTSLEMLWSMRDADYPSDAIEAWWKTLLLHQFHDILPGSSVRDVYEEARASLNQALHAIGESEAAWAEACLQTAPDYLTFFNPLSTAYRDLVAMPKEWRDVSLIGDNGSNIPTQSDGDTMWAAVDVPAWSFATFKRAANPAPQPSSRSDRVLENKLVRFEFNEHGRLIGMREVASGRAFMSVGQEGNRLCLYHDRPAQWEAWDMDVFYEDEMMEVVRCTSISDVIHGPVFSQLMLTFTIGAASTMCQTVRLRKDSARLDFITTVDWREERRLLRVHFPTAIMASEATYDIQHGTIKRPTHRNTSRDMAMFEVCGHRYADLSQPDIGVALLNDGKYGYQVRGNELSLSLLASPMMPDPGADRGEHTFTYAILPHPDDHRNPVIRAEAGALNRKPIVWANREPRQTLGLPIMLDGADLCLEALKKAEGGEGWIVRLSETAGKTSRGYLRFPAPVRLIETNAVEHAAGPAREAGRELTIALKPFQVRTWRFQRV